MFPDIQSELPLFQFVHIAPGPVTGYHRNESGSPIRNSYTLIRFPPSLLFYRLNSLSHFTPNPLSSLEEKEDLRNYRLV